MIARAAAVKGELDAIYGSQPTVVEHKCGHVLTYLAHVRDADALQDAIGRKYQDLLRSRH